MAHEEGFVVHHRDRRGRVADAVPPSRGGGEDVHVRCSGVGDEQALVASGELQPVRVRDAAQDADGCRPGAAQGRMVVDEDRVREVVADRDPASVARDRDAVGNGGESSVLVFVAPDRVRPADAREDLVPIRPVRRTATEPGASSGSLAAAWASGLSSQSPVPAPGAGRRNTPTPSQRLATTIVSSSRKSTPCGSRIEGDDRSSTFSIAMAGPSAVAASSTFGHGDHVAEVAGNRQPAPTRRESHVLGPPEGRQRLAHVGGRVELELG